MLDENDWPFSGACYRVPKPFVPYPLVDRFGRVLWLLPPLPGPTARYVTVAAGATGKILFVVPTEPLVWQVAALFNKLLRGQVR